MKCSMALTCKVHRGTQKHCKFKTLKLLWPIVYSMFHHKNVSSSFSSNNDKQAPLKKFIRLMHMYYLLNDSSQFTMSFCADVSCNITLMSCIY